MADRTGTQPALSDRERAAAEKLASDIVMQLEPLLQELDRKLNEVIKKLDALIAEQAERAARAEEIARLNGWI